MKTIKLKTLLQEQFNKMTEGATQLFEVDVDKDIAWNTYLDSFPEGHNEIYLERREFDCNACSLFIKTVSNVVSIKNGKVMSVWDIDTECDTYSTVVDAMKKLIHNSPIKGVFYYDSKEMSFGQDSNKVLLEDGTVKTWQHLYVPVPKKFQRTRGDSSATVRGKYNGIKQVFQRGLSELTVEALEVVLELITQGSLYKGDEWKNIVTGFLDIKKQYDKLSSNEGELFIWEKSVELTGSLTGLRNTSMGTLLVDISNGENLDTAVRKYEKIVAPSNYKRPKAIFTKKMLEDAQKTVVELGYQDSLQRRYATLDDITVNNILFSNKDSANRINDAKDVFAQLSASIPENPKKFSKVDEISIEDFVKNVLPTTASLEAFVENKHSSNFVSLIAPENVEAPSMFKWDNAFGWAYTGNITDSTMKENVKNAGGKVDGVLRFSIQWNDVGADIIDLDAHCIEPRGNHISYGNKNNYRTSGNLDVDIRSPYQDKAAVENITWSKLHQMDDGVYKFYVHNYSSRGTKHGFRAEIEFNGEIYSFDYNKPTRGNESIVVAEVTLKDGKFAIKELLPSNVSSKDVWGVQTNQFVPVSVAMFSPNYWNEQQGIGHKHYLFMLKDCINPELPNGFYNEFLKEDLLKHKRVFEALGGKLAVKEVDDQLSGIGFSSTQRNELLVKVTGQTERLLKIKF